MNKGTFGIIIILLIISLKSWGSVSLPRLSSMPVDTLPVKQDQPVTTSVIKEVPRAKKQIKPIAVPTTVVPVKVPVVKPKIVIKSIGVRIH